MDVREKFEKMKNDVNVKITHDVVEPIPAVAYYRMSSDKQETSIGFQKATVEARFGGRFQVVQEYLDEGKSGSKDTKKRTSFLGMIEDLSHGKHKGKVKVVLCLDLSRFGRLDTITGAEYKKSLRRAGVRLETVNEGIIDWSTMTGRIMDSVLSESHNAFALLVGKKGLEGRIAKTKAGQFNGGSVPYGCHKHVLDDQGNELVIKRTSKFAKPKSWKGVLAPGDPDEVEAVLWLYEQFDVRDVSFRQLAIEAQEKGFPSPTGTGWRGQFVQAILENHAYVGDAAIGKKTDGAFFRHDEGEVKPVDDVQGKPTPTVHRNAYKATIPRDLWDRVQAKIARRETSRSKPQGNGGYALTGVLLCGNCGKSMSAHPEKNGEVRYICQNASKNPSLGCKYWLAHERTLLPFLIEKMVEVMDSRALELLAAQPPSTAKRGSQVTRMEAKHSKLKKDIERGRENFLAAPKTLAAGLADTLERWEAERQRLEAEIRSAKASGDDIEDWKQLAAAWTEEIKPKLVNVKTGEKVRVKNHWLERAGINEVDVEFGVETAVMRETLHKLKSKIWLWFVPKKNGRGWEIDRGRFKAEVDRQVYYDGPSTLGKSQARPKRPTRVSG